MSIHGRPRTSVSKSGSTKLVGDVTLSSTQFLLTQSAQNIAFALGTGSITSAELAASLTDETGTGSAVFALAPFLSFPTTEGLILTGNIDNGIAHGPNGSRLSSSSFALTTNDSVSAAATVIAQASVDTFDSLSVTATNAITITNMLGCIFRLPTAGTNVTVTNNAYAVGIESLVVGTAGMANLEYIVAGTVTKGGIFTSQNANNSPGGLVFNRSSATQSNAPELNMSKSKGTTASKTVIASGETLGRVNFLGYDGTDFGYGARIVAVCTEATPGAAAMGTRLDFMTSPAGTETPATGMSLSSEKILTLSGTLVPRTGSATAGTAPIKMTSGTLLTTAEAGAVEFLTDKFYGTITTGAARKELTLNDAALTSGRVPFVTTNGRITDDSSWTFSTSTGITLTDKNFVLGTTTGTKFGTATTQKLSFFNSTPVVQPSTTGESTGFTAGGGTNVTDSSTFTGNVGSTAYRISDIVKHLKNLGLIAQ